MYTYVDYNEICHSESFIRTENLFFSYGEKKNISNKVGHLSFHHYKSSVFQRG